MSFKKKVINTSIEAIQEAEKRAKKKISILNSAVAEAGKHIEVTYLKKFSEDFMTYTTEKIMSENKGLKDLNLSIEKVLNLLEIDLKNLYELQLLFEENEAKILFDKNGKPFYKIDKNDYTLFTKNEEENKKVDAIHKFIDAIEELEKHVHIYKGGITPLTSNLLRYDLRLMDWEINQEYFR